jgi:hypothetical protein
MIDEYRSVATAVARLGLRRPAGLAGTTAGVRVDLGCKAQEGSTRSRMVSSSARSWSSISRV